MVQAAARNLAPTSASGTHKETIRRNGVEKPPRNNRATTAEVMSAPATRAKPHSRRNRSMKRRSARTPRTARAGQLEQGRRRGARAQGGRGRPSPFRLSGETVTEGLDGLRERTDSIPQGSAPNSPKWRRRHRVSARRFRAYSCIRRTPPAACASPLRGVAGAGGFVRDRRAGNPEDGDQDIDADIQASEWR